jgi:protein JSN1
VKKWRPRLCVASDSDVPFRARQIQADEGILASAYRPPAMRLGASSAEQAGASLQTARPASSSLLIDEQVNPGESRLFRGRARAGTLPSSWSDVVDHHSPTSQARLSPDIPTNVIGNESPLTYASGQPWSSTGNHFNMSPSDIIGTDRLASPNSSPSLFTTYATASNPIPSIGTSKLAPSRQIRSSTTAEFDRAGLYSPLAMNSTTYSTSPSASAAAFDNNGNSAASLSNRHRSGSLTSTLSGLGNNAFGPSIFTSTWSGQPGQGRAAVSPIMPLTSRSNTFSSSPLEDQGGRGRLSFATTDDKEEQHMDESEGVHTLDYLGLDQDDAASHRGPMRNRARTLASVPSRNNADHSQYQEDDTAQYDEDTSEDMYSTYARGGDASSLAAMASVAGLQGSSLHSGRHRAGTVAALGGPGGRQRIEQEMMRMTLLGTGNGLNGLGFNSLVNSLQGVSGPSESRYGKAPLEGFPHLDISTPPLTAALRSSPFHTSPPTPSSLLPSANMVSSSLEESPYSAWSGNGQDTAARSTNQTPSRSLWIGNLDSNTTGQELMRVFAPYGAIESLRLLPEKECGFVNFVEINDAVRAREDVLGRLGARLEQLGTGPGATVRIGFGKIDSAANHAYRPATLPGIAGTASISQGNETMQSNPDVLAASAPMTPGGSEGIGPTRALWVGSIPSSVTSAMLLNIFQPFGSVESARILTHKNCGFINFERVDDAVRARKMLNNRDVLGSEVGAMRIGFAKVPTRNIESYPAQGPDYEAALDSLETLQGARSVSRSPEQQVAAGLENYRSNFVVSLLNQEVVDSAPANGSPVMQQQQQQQQHIKQTASSSSSIVPASDKGGVPLPPHMAPRASVSDLQLLMSQLSAGQASKDVDVASVTEYRPSATYYMTIPLVSEVSSGRRFETSRLRETRKSIESGLVGVRECDLLASEYLDSIVDLASDYIGNTLVQKFFEHCSEQIKTDMLQRLAPHLAMTGCHKNGTWAAQKILDCCKSIEQISLIAKHLRPYIPGLLLDQFGNYVVQCCLPWQQPLNDFVFDAMVDRCWEIAQGRFGARSMRACLEKDTVTDQQRKRVAMAVILNSIPLATSPNGSILLTWLLDTSGLSKSYKLLAPRFSPHLTHLCTHKLASTPVLRLVNQSFEPEASRVILDALFESSQDHVLEEIVVDQVHGSQFVTKVLASTALTKQQREQYSSQVRSLIDKHRLVGVPAYRRLCEDLGLLASSSQGGMERTTRAVSATNGGAEPFQMRSAAMMPPGQANLKAGGPSQDVFNPYWDPAYRRQNSPGHTNLKRQ